MQTPISPILPSNSSPAGSAPKAAAPASGQFQRTLSRQIEQRQALAQSHNQAQSRSAEARTKADAKTASNPAAPETAPAATTPATAAKPAEASAKPDGEDDQNDAAAQPLSDMLMLVASLQQTMARGQVAEAGSAADRSAAVLSGVDKAAAALLDTDTTAALLGSNAAADKAAAALLTTQSDSFDLKLAASAPTAAALPKAGALDAALPGTVNLAAPTAQAALQITQAASAVATDKLNGQVGSPAWDQQLGQKVIWMAAGGMQSATLMLNPPDLGPLQVVLNVSNDQATVSFTSAQPEVRQALEAAMPKLREMMGEAGVSLGNTSVSEGNANQDRGNAPQRARSGGIAEGDSEMVQAISVPAARGAALPGMVDTFA